MKKLLETLSDILMFLLFVFFVFLFNGEPDLWDVMHAAAMAKFK